MTAYNKMDTPILIVSICVGKSIFQESREQLSTNNTVPFATFVSLTRFLKYFNLDLVCRRKCSLKAFLIWSSVSIFVQQRGTICAILVAGIRNNSVKLF